MRWVVATVLIAAVVAIAVDAARRAATLAVFAEGHGVPTTSPPEAFRAAEWNVPYLLGLAVGGVSGVGLAALGSRLAEARQRRGR